MKSYKNLWKTFISEENIREAIKNVCKHKTNRRKFRDLKYNSDKYIEWIKEIASNFKNSPHSPILIYDGISRKQRTIIVPSFAEQIIHHMLVNVLKPIILKPMYRHSYGSIPGRGGHMAMKRISRVISKHRNRRDIKYVLKMDIRKYFDSIPHDKLKAFISRKIRDRKLLNLILEIIDVTEVGIPLGFYTSQWIANWYLTDLDHFIKEKLHVKYYYRYMDDMVIFGSSKADLHKVKIAIEEELHKLGLNMKQDWQVFRFERDGKFRFLDFMGFRFYRNRTTLRRTIYLKSCRKAKKLYKKGYDITVYDCRQMLSYLGWIDATDTYGAYLKYIKPYVSIKKLKKKISRYERRNNKNAKIQDSAWITGINAAA